MNKEIIIIGTSNYSREGITLHLNKPGTLKTGNIKSKKFWISWDKIGENLFDEYTKLESVCDRNDLRQKFQKED